MEQWFSCDLPDDALQGFSIHVNKDMSVIKRTDLKTGKVHYAALFKMLSGAYKRSGYFDSIKELRGMTYLHAVVKWLPARQQRLNELSFEIPILLT